MNFDKCKVKECDREHRSARYCAAHYLQVYKYGKITKDILGPIGSRPNYVKNEGECTWDGCERDQHTKQMCTMHYQRSRKEMARNDG